LPGNGTVAKTAFPLKQKKTDDGDIIEPSDGFLAMGTKGGGGKNLASAFPAEETDVQKTTYTGAKNERKRREQSLDKVTSIIIKRWVARGHPSFYA
jgi:hypothetical protein